MNKSDVDWCPSLFLGHDKQAANCTEAAVERARRYEARSQNSCSSLVEASQSASSCDEQCSTTSTSCTSTCTKMVQTELSLSVASDNFFNEAQFTSSDAKVHYYTGLPNAEVLISTFNYLVPFPGMKRDYYWKSFLVMLLKLRLNIGFQDLAYRLNVSFSTISQRFHEMLNIAPSSA